jgi:hypothetical protein
LLKLKISGKVLKSKSGDLEKDFFMPLWMLASLLEKEKL